MLSSNPACCHGVRKELEPALKAAIISLPSSGIFSLHIRVFTYSTALTRKNVVVVVGGGGHRTNSLWIWPLPFYPEWDTPLFWAQKGTQTGMKLQGLGEQCQVGCLCHWGKSDAADYWGTVPEDLETKRIQELILLLINPVTWQLPLHDKNAWSLIYADGGLGQVSKRTIKVALFVRRCTYSSLIKFWPNRSLAQIVLNLYKFDLPNDDSPTWGGLKAPH